jgi:hypothetical protein
MQRQDGASDPTDDAEKKDENEDDEDTKRHRVASVWLAISQSLLTPASF